MEKRKQFALRTDQLSEELYNYIDRQIKEYGSFKSYVEHIAERDRRDELGKLFTQFKDEISQDILADMKSELNYLKHFIQEQFEIRSFKKSDNPTENQEHREEKTKQLYDINELKVTGQIEEDTEVDF